MPKAPKPSKSSKPAKTKPAKSTPAEGEPAKSTPAEGELAEGKPGKAKPAKTKSGKAKPAKSTPAEATPAEGKKPKAKKVEHPSVVARIERGKAARAAAPRESHAGFRVASDRLDPIVILEKQAQTRTPKLVPIRYGRMAASPFAFYRGAAAVMAADLANTPDSGLHVQACGDAHLVNFGVYSSPERSLVFDINDFDETTRGPWEWDVKRLAASFAVAARSRGFDRATRDGIIRSVGRSYREAMATFAEQGNLEVWYAKLDMDELIARFGAQADAQTRKRVRKGRDKALSRDSEQAFGKLTEIVDGEARFISQPPLLVPLYELLPGENAQEVEAGLHNMLREYRDTLPDDRRILLEQYELVDIAHKVVGVGSVGTRCWVLLMIGRDLGDPLLLQVKQAEESVLEPYVGRSEFDNAGERAVVGQKLMQAVSDIFLGWNRMVDLQGVSRDYYFRQLRDGKGSANVDVMTSQTMDVYAQMCGWTLARAHARSGDRVALAAYLGTSAAFDKAIVAFSEDYADQNDLDHSELVRAIDDGRIEAREGI
jgi:uncharacterized protein (DUF2252 family)